MAAAAKQPSAMAFFDDRPVDHWIGFVVAAAAGMTQAALWGVRATISTFARAIDHDQHFCGGPTPDGTPCTSDHLTATAAGIAMGLGPICGIAAGTLTQRFGASTVVIISAVLIALSLVLSTYATTKAEFLLAYAPLMGVGSGFMVTPGAVAAGTRFARFIGIGMGIVYAGGGFGSALLPKLAGALLHKFGSEEWRVAQRWLALSALVGLIAGFFVRTRNMNLDGAKNDGVQAEEAADDADRIDSPSINRYDSDVVVLPATAATGDGAAAPLLVEAGGDKPADEKQVAVVTTEEEQQPPPSVVDHLKSGRYIFSVLAAVCYGYHYYASMYYIVPYSRAQGEPGGYYSDETRIDILQATTNMLIFGMAQGIGSIVLGFLAERMDKYVLYLVCCLASGGVNFAFGFVHSVVGIAGLSATLGVFSAGARLCFPSMVTEMFIGPHIGTMMGITLAGYGVGALPGPPVSSVMIHAANGNYVPAYSIMGGLVCMSGLIAFFGMRRFRPPALATTDLQ